MSFSSTGCYGWSFSFDPFGFAPSQERNEVSSDGEDHHDTPAPQALDKWGFPIRPACGAIPALDKWGFPIGPCDGGEPMNDAVAISMSRKAYSAHLDSRPAQSSPARVHLHDASKQISFSAYEGAEMNVGEEVTPFSKTRGIPGSPSCSIGDETTTTESDSASPAWAETSTTSDLDSTSSRAENGKHLDPVARKYSRRCLVAVIVGICLLATIAFATLGATGHFAKAPPATTSSSIVSSTGDDVEEPDELLQTGSTTESVDTSNVHDTEEPEEDGTNEHNTEEPDTAEFEGPTAGATSTDSAVEGATVGPDTTEDNATPTTTVSTATAAGPMTYVPGLLTVEENGLLLSQGLTSRIIAERRRPVQYADGSESDEPFHRRPDYGATFPMLPEDTENEGGWVYVSNSELKGPPGGEGGVGALYFNKEGQVINYQMLLTNTTKNCAGGRTPWGTFISCEEVEEVGQIYQVDPFNRRPPERITMGMLGGRYEAFAYDDRDKSAPRFFVTEDLKNGPTLRWTPHNETIDWNEPWNILTGSGTLEYLLLKPNAAAADNSYGTIEWTQDLTLARANAALYARGTEGIDRNGSFLYFVCKTDSLFYIVDLDNGTFVRQSTTIGLFDGEPDQVKRIVNDTQDILYFGEEASGPSEISGIHGRNSKGQFFTILETPGYATEETTGLAFSPDCLHMYFCLQDPGLVFDITRTDGHPFHGSSLDIHYHANPPLDHLLRR